MIVYLENMLILVLQVMRVLPQVYRSLRDLDILVLVADGFKWIPDCIVHLKLMLSEPRVTRLCFAKVYVVSG